MTERRQLEFFRNQGHKPLTIVLEPWSIRQVLAPGEGVCVVAQGPAGGALEIDRGEEEIVVYGWSGSRVAFTAYSDADARNVCEALMAEVLAEAQRFDNLQEMGNYSANPFAPGAVADRFKEIGEAAAPYLISMIQQERPETQWALVALQALGPVAKAASDALATRCARDTWTARTLYYVDPDRALAMGLHRRPETYRLLVDDGFVHGPQMYARIAGELLADRNPAMLRLAYSSGQSLSANLQKLAKAAPALVPVHLVRAHTLHSDRDIVQAARQVLRALGDPGPA